MFLRICQGYSNIISFRHNFKRLLAFFDLTYETKSVLSVEDVCDGIPDTIVRADLIARPQLSTKNGATFKTGPPFQSFHLISVSQGQNQNY